MSAWITIAVLLGVPIAFVVWVTKHDNPKGGGTVDNRILLRSTSATETTFPCEQSGDPKDDDSKLRLDLIIILSCLTQKMPVTTPELEHDVPDGIKQMGLDEFETFMYGWDNNFAREIEASRVFLRELQPDSISAGQARIMIERRIEEELSEWQCNLVKKEKVQETARTLLLYAPTARETIESWGQARLKRIDKFVRQGVTFMHLRRTLACLLKLVETKGMRLPPSEELSAGVTVLRVTTDILEEAHIEALAASAAGRKSDLALCEAMKNLMLD